VPEVREKAWSKLNLTLDVLGARPDGFHEVKMVMQTVTLHDDLRICCMPGTGNATVRTNRPYIPGDLRNIAAKAAVLFFSSLDIRDTDAVIHIRKRIPVGAGMAGGSADAAAVLRGMNRMFAAGLSVRELETLGASLGSDVPFCIAGGTVVATGRGEVLQQLPALPDCRFAICKPSFSASTPELYHRLDSTDVTCHPDTDGVLAALQTGSLCGVAHRVFNVFESAMGRHGREISRIKDTMFDHGAIGAAMTGTGSAVFGIFREETAAQAACSALKPEYRECFTAQPLARLAL